MTYDEILKPLTLEDDAIDPADDPEENDPETETPLGPEEEESEEVPGGETVEEL